MLTKKYPSTTRIVGIVLRSYIPNSGGTIGFPVFLVFTIYFFRLDFFYQILNVTRKYVIL